MENQAKHAIEHMLVFVYGCMAPDRFDAAAKAGRLAEDLPSNHSALFAPQILPTMQVGIDAYAASTLAWLSKDLNSG